jgi:two-component system sensor histidine kinase TctE
MAPLVASLNGFTGRLSRSLARSEDFITEAAHRLRTPLATVRTQAEVILRRVDREDNRAGLKDIIRAADQTSRAAGQLLDQAMVNLRTDALDRSEVSLADCIGDVVARQKPVADLRDIALIAEFDDIPPVLADPILIQNAITNIIDNAIKYAPAESTVRVGVTSTGAEAVISVRDEGPGFGDDEPGDLLRRFQRGRAGAGTVGSGLGLTIASDVFAAHKGRIALTNVKGGRGACVVACLPH